MVIMMISAHTMRTEFVASCGEDTAIKNVSNNEASASRG